MVRRILDALGRGRTGGVLVTLALLNVCVVLLTGGYKLPTWPLSISVHSLTASVAGFVALAAWRLLWPRRDKLSRASAVAWISRWSVPLTIAGLVLGGFLLRVWGLRDGLPAITHPDEPDVVGHAIDMLKRSSLDPRWYHYPTLFMNLLLPSFGAYFIVGVGQGLWRTVADVPTDAAGFYLIARWHAAVLGTATIGFTYMLGRRVVAGFDPRVGVIAAALVAVSFNSVRSSHEAVTDVPMTALATLALLAILKVCQEGRRRDYVIAGLVIGLACSTKYTAAPLVLSFGLAHALSRPVRQWISLDALLGALAMPAGFFIGSPAVLFDWHIFLEHVGWLQSFSGAAPPDEVVQRAGQVGSYSLESGFGWVGAVAAVAGLIAALHRRRREDLVLAAFVLFSLVAITHSSHRWFPRYLVPLYPAVYALTGVLLVRLADAARLRWRLRPIHAALGLAVIVIVMAAPQLSEALQYDRMMAEQQHQQ